MKKRSHPHTTLQSALTHPPMAGTDTMLLLTAQQQANTYTETILEANVPCGNSLPACWPYCSIAVIRGDALCLP